MQLCELNLRGFRNYDDQHFSFDPGVNLIVGRNAQGKPNLLESIAFLGSGKSFRAQKTAEMIGFSRDFGELEGVVLSQDREQTLRWVLFPGGRPRQLWQNGVKKKSASELTGVLPTVLFCPEDLMILKSGGAARRRFADLVLCALRPNYEAALTEYGRILAQKSRILKDSAEDIRLLSILPDYNIRLCQVGALLIFDEIQTGIGRTVKLLACDYENIHPDILILGKALSGGVTPVSAVLANDEIMLTIAPGEHGSTYGGNPLAAAVGIAALEVVRDEHLSENAYEMGELFRSEMQKIDNPMIKQVRGKGLLNAVVTEPRGGKVAWDICLALKENGLIAKPTHDHIIRFTPPLVITREQMMEAIGIIKETLS